MIKRLLFVLVAALIWGSSQSAIFLQDTGGGGGAFDPETDVSSATLKVGYVFSDTSSMYQNTGCTTAVTTTSDPVQCVEDISSNGDDLTEGTSPPLYDSTLFTSGGITFTDDRLNTSGLTGSIDGFTIYIYAEITTGAYEDVLVALETGAGGVYVTEGNVGISTWADNEFYIYYRDDTQVDFAATTSGEHLYKVTYDYGQVNPQMYADGTEMTGTFGGTIFTSGSTSLTPTNLTLGQPRDGTSGYSLPDGDICAVLVYEGYPDAGDEADIETWFTASDGADC